MLPFISIGSHQFASYGVMMATAFLIAYYMLKADLRRRGLKLSAGLLVLSIGLGGLLASRLYLVLESPSQFLAHPALLLGRSGFTFYGGLLGAVLVILALGRVYRIGTLALFDTLSAEAALGYGIGRIGCLLAGDGDYGTPTALPWGMSFPHGLVPTLERVHPTPAYEFIAAALISAWLWRLGAPGAAQPRAPGEVFGWYLVLTGVARFLVEFIRINPPVLAGLTNAQCVALISIAAGGALLLRCLSRKSAAAPVQPAVPRGI